MKKIADHTRARNDSNIEYTHYHPLVHSIWKIGPPSNCWIPRHVDTSTDTKVWRCAVPTPLRRLFDYRPPEDWQGTVVPGMRVIVPFGRRSVTAIVVREALDSAIPRDQLRSVSSVLDRHPLYPALYWRYFSGQPTITSTLLVKSCHWVCPPASVRANPSAPLPTPGLLLQSAGEAFLKAHPTTPASKLN